MRAGTSTIRPPAVRNADQLKLPFDSLIDQEPDHVNAQQGAATAARIYRDGALVAENRYGVGTFNVGTAQPATYRVELDMSQGRPGWALTSESYSAWTFRSARPATAGPEPLQTLTANWDLDLDLNNAAPAGKAFTLRLNAAHQPAAQQTPIQGAKVWASFDDGGTWKQVAVTTTGGQFTGNVRHPKLSDTTGYVALRFEVTDAAGGKMEQTVYRAYALK
jgi:hypothetical protein